MRLKLLFILILIIFPFSISNYTDDITPEKITSDLRFYEINTCSISLTEFLIQNPNVIYQDHYKIKFNNYSSIRCFGQITGIDQIGYEFYISIGTNTIVNLFLQSTIWLLLISTIKATSKSNIKLYNITNILIVTFLMLGGILSQKRFYSKSLFLIKIDTYSSMAYLFIYFLYVCFFCYLILHQRRDSLINYLPFSILFLSLYSGLNLYFLSIYFLFYGLDYFKKNKNLRTPLFLITIFWGYQSLELNYFLDPDKIRGLSSTIYNFPASVYWSTYTFLLFFGIFNFVLKNYKSFNQELFTKNLIFSLLSVLLLGFLGSSNPLFNFLNFYIFGLTKYGTTNQKYFESNQWGEIVAWRGFYPSAESIGELFALGLFLLFLYYFSTKGNNKSNIIFYSFPLLLLGLYLSNNKAAFVSLIYICILKIIRETEISYFNKNLIYIILLSLVFLSVGYSNVFYSIEAASNSIFDSANTYALEDNYSKALLYINMNYNNSSIIIWIFKLISVFAFYINRSELWGIFLSRYNPTSSELFFGIGPFQFPKLYSEINIKSTRSFLLPHSSLLSLILFFGLIIVMFVIGIYLFKLFKNRHRNYDMFLINIFMILNLVKSDSILYFPNLLIYILFISIYFARSKPPVLLNGQR